PTDMAEATARVLTFWKQDKDQFDLPVAHVLSQLRSDKSR
ncbi:phosphogluconate dehydrogenase, partial [Streptomyces sp. SID7499]|nr:phosphogluconate dehydrogenase [Streptomyces sp. SID7499]